MDKQKAILRAKERAKIKNQENEESMRKSYAALREFLRPSFECSVCGKQLNGNFISWKTEEGSSFSNHEECKIENRDYVSKRVFEDGIVKEAYVLKNGEWEHISKKEMKKLQQLTKLSENFF